MAGAAAGVGYGVPPAQRQQPGGVLPGGRPVASYASSQMELLNLLNKSTGGSREDGSAFESGDFPPLAQGGAAPRVLSNPGTHSGEGHVGEATFASLLTKPAGQTAAPAAAQQHPQHHQQPRFQEDDFPALPAMGSSSGVGAASEPTPPAAAAAQAAAAGAGTAAAAASAAAAAQESKESDADRYGLLGLLSVIRMTDPDLTTLALGTDLTTLGLNLSLPEPLWWTFGSPWTDRPVVDHEPDGRPPEPLLQPAPRLTAAMLAKMQPDSLFYAFYGLPGDEVQFLAAAELNARGWSFSRELEAWITPAPSQDPSGAPGDSGYFVFDPNAWEVVRRDERGPAPPPADRSVQLPGSTDAGLAPH